MAKGTKVTYRPGPDGPKSTTWAGQKMEAGKAVTIQDEALVEKARNNPYFEVSGDRDQVKQGDDQGGDTAMATPKLPTETPMFPQSHTKADVVPGGVMTAEQSEIKDDEPDAPPKRGRKA